MKKLLLFLGVGAAFLYYKSANDFVKACSIKIKKVFFDIKRSTDTAGRTMFFTVSAQVKNPTKFTANITRVDAQLYFKDQLVASSRSIQKIKLKPAGETDFSFPVAIDLTRAVDVVRSLKDSLFTGGRVPFVVKAQFTAGVGTLKAIQEVTI